MLSALVSLLLLAASPAHAACDAKGLEKQISAATPQQIPQLFVDLAACDAAAAKRIAPSALPKLIPGDKASAAAVAALRVGASADVVSWVKGQQPDDRGQTIAHLSEACGTTKEVQTFFLNAATTMGDDFWNERWYRGLSSCRAPEIQKLLTDKLSAMEKGDPGRFQGVLEVFARNLGAAALPQLKALALGTQNAELQVYVVNAFGDAAGLGSLSGADPTAGQEAAKTLKAIAPDLQPKAVEQARTILQALGDELGADELAGVRYKSVRQADGTYMWGTVVTETATCKNGKTQQLVHVAPVLDTGRTWGDQVKDRVSAGINAWSMDLAQKCKGTGTHEVMVSGEPFADQAAFKAWVDGQLNEIQRQPADKRTRVDHEALKL